MSGGLVLGYAALNDPPGGPVGVVKSVLLGKVPDRGVQKITPGRQLGETVGGLIGGTGSGVGNAVGNAVANGSRGSIIATAKTYLGVKYVWGGASRRGVDCSGLVLLAYKSVGISLPHKASLQMGKGRRISRAEVKPGDLVGWGAPGNYPHIALALNADQVIVAPHTGTVVQVQKLWQKAVPGFGYPDIVRILKD